MDKELLAIELGELESLEFDNSILGFELSKLEELKRGLDSLKDGIEDGGEKPIDEADTKATIGSYSFVIPREEYLEWIENLKQKVDFDRETITNEIKSRLSL